MSVLGTSTARRTQDLLVIDRDSRQLKQRPLPPRPISLVAGVLLWDYPQFTANVTHFRIYNVDGQRFAEVSAGQTKLIGFDSARAYLTSYDSRTDLESYQASVAGSAASSGGFLTPAEYLLTASSTNVTALGTGTAGELRYVIIETDATAGRQIVWDATFLGVTVDDIVNAANWTNIYGFLSRGGSDWWNISKVHYETP